MLLPLRSPRLVNEAGLSRRGGGGRGVGYPDGREIAEPINSRESGEQVGQISHTEDAVIQRSVRQLEPCSGHY